MKTMAPILREVLAATTSKRKAVAFVGSEPELLVSFTKGVKDTSSKVKVVNIPFSR